MRADVAQLVEHSLGKGEVTSSILVIGSRIWLYIPTAPETVVPETRSMSQVGFEQAGIAVERPEQFGALRSSVERVFSPANVESFLKKLVSNSVNVRDFETVLNKKLFEQVDKTLSASGTTALALWQQLTVADQGQMREFYLTHLEELDLALRQKYSKIYRYY